VQGEQSGEPVDQRQPAAGLFQIPVGLGRRFRTARRSYPPGNLWDEIDALYIGGDTAWKLREHAADLAAVASSVGKWVHMGRVNSAKRYRYAEAIGCYSVDGTYLTFGPRQEPPPPPSVATHERPTRLVRMRKDPDMPTTPPIVYAVQPVPAPRTKQEVP
jgi:hypothetical protein